VSSSGDTDTAGCSSGNGSVPQRQSHQVDHYQHRGNVGDNIDGVVTGGAVVRSSPVPPPPADEIPTSTQPPGSDTVTLNTDARSSSLPPPQNAVVVDGSADTGGRSTMTSRSASTCRVSPADR